MATLLNACGAWVRSHHPEPLQKGALVEVSSDAANIEIFVDEFGVPTITAQREIDAYFGLGFMHGRDRAFQVMLLRHAATGRLTELFGEPALGADRKLRLLTFGIAAIEERLPASERAAMERYLEGINEGAKNAGKSAEMALLGVEWTPMSVRDLISISRLQSWNLSRDFEAELARTRLTARLPPDDPRLQALLRDVPSNGVAILEGHEVSERKPLPSTARLSPKRDAIAKDPAREFLAMLGLTGDGGSNAWVVNGSFTSSGKPILCNDPHLAHRAPGVFYLARLIAQEGALDVSGATFPGLPAVLIGHNQRVAWSMTTSYADTQDLVELTLVAYDPSHYVLDGEPRAFTKKVERFVHKDKVLLEEEFRSSAFGPVLPPAYAAQSEPGRVYSLLWTGFIPEINASSMRGFWSLAKSRTVEEAKLALEPVGGASQSMLLADTEGSIAFHLLGTLPRRSRPDRTDLPRDGRSRAAGWAGVIPEEDKPSAVNPTRGWMATANQRVAVIQRFRDRSGGYGWTPHRAEMIHGELKKMLDKGKVNRESLKNIQLNSGSTESARLAKPLAERCPTSVVGHPPARVKAFCEGLSSFAKEPVFNEDSIAVPFLMLLHSLREEVVALHLGEDAIPQLAWQSFVIMAIEEDILAEIAGERSPLFDDKKTANHDGLDGLLQLAAKRALDDLVERERVDPKYWRWGAVHTLSFASPLAAAPLVGGEFKTEPMEVPGETQAPRAESGVPVTHGAALRMAVEMSTPPKAGFVLDFGQSGHPGHRNWGDMSPKWVKGELIELGGDLNAVKARAKSSFRFKTAAAK